MQTPSALAHRAHTLRDDSEILKLRASISPPMLQELRRERHALIDEVDRLRDGANLVPELERELLFHADRAEYLANLVTELEARNRRLQVMAHARSRSQQYLTGARILRPLLCGFADAAARRALVRWSCLARSNPEPEAPSAPQHMHDDPSIARYHAATTAPRVEAFMEVVDWQPPLQPPMLSPQQQPRQPPRQPPRQRSRPPPQVVLDVLTPRSIPLPIPSPPVAPASPSFGAELLAKLQHENVVLQKSAVKQAKQQSRAVAAALLCGVLRRREDWLLSSCFSQWRASQLAWQ